MMLGIRVYINEQVHWLGLALDLEKATLSVGGTTQKAGSLDEYKGTEGRFAAASSLCPSFAAPHPPDLLPLCCSNLPQSSLTVA